MRQKLDFEYKIQPDICLKDSPGYRIPICSYIRFNPTEDGKIKLSYVSFTPSKFSGELSGEKPRQV